MAIKVTLKRKESTKPEEFHGENVTVEGLVMKIHTEPHEVVAGGMVDLFVGDVVVLSPGDVARVRRV